MLVDEADDSLEPQLLVYLEHAIRDGRTGRSGEPRAISQRLQFIFLKEDGSATDGGPAPYLDCRPITPEERVAVADAIAAPWLSGNVEAQALGYAMRSLVPDHLNEVRTRRIAEIDKVEREVRARLNREINYWDARAARLREEERAGKEQRINAQNAEATAARLVERLHQRQAELDRERQISALPPVLKGAALVIPGGLLKATSRAGPDEQADGLCGRPDRPRAESSGSPWKRSWRPSARLATSRGTCRPRRRAGISRAAIVRAGPSALHRGQGPACGGSRRDRDQERNPRLAQRRRGLYSCDRPDRRRFRPRAVYVRRFFKRELGFAETAVVFDVADLLSLGGKPN